METTAATVETAATTTMEASNARATGTTTESASHCAAAVSAAITCAPITIATASITVAAAIAITGASIAVAAPITIAATEPRPGTNKDTAVEPRRTVVAIRSTGVGIVAVVAVGADWGIPAVTIATVRRSDPNANPDLSVRISRCRE
jgi:hypothetical protein